MTSSGIKHKTLSVQKARNGNGIFTKRTFGKDEVVFEVKGKFMTCYEEEEVDEETRANTYRYDETLYISPKGTVGDFLNHSCNPNAKVVKVGKKLYVKAIRSIPQGREVTIDYSTIIAVDDTWTMRCNCGSALCRKKIGMHTSLPKKLKKAYIEREIIPRFILDIV